MWFLTVDPLIRISVFIAKLPSDKTAGVFSRTFIVKDISNSLTYTVASSCVCTSPVAVPTIVGLHHFVKVSISTRRSRQQILVPQDYDLMQVGTNFPKVRKMLLCFSPFDFRTLLATCHAASRAPCSCHSVSS